MYRRQNDNRVNEKDVPESQHTIFIRGLPGSTSTNVVKEFFEENVGTCSFDFIKVSQDRTKLFVAVRFESKSAAKEAIDRYKDGEVLGHRVELSYFRDIRRYLTHVQKQGRHFNPRNDMRTGRRFVRGNRRSRSRSRSISRSRSRSPTKSRSRSIGSRSPSRSQSSVHSSERSVRRGETVDEVIKNEPAEIMSPIPLKKPKKVKKEKKKKRKVVSPSASPVDNQSDMDTSDGELLHDELDVGSRQQNNLESISQETQQAVVVRNNVSIDSGTAAKQMSPRSRNGYGSAQNSVDSGLNGIEQGRENSAKGGFLPFGKQQDHLKENPPVRSKEQMYKAYHEPMTITTSLPTQHNVNNNNSFVEQSPKELGCAMTNFSVIQNRILQDVRYRQESSDEDQMGNFRLSSLSTQKSTNAMREERIQKLSTEMREKVEKKKHRLELSYRKDCECFSLMTNKLIGKDRGLEGRLRLALLEVMKDLESEAQKALDEYLDQLLFLST